MTTDRPGRVLASQWPYLLHIARNARDDTKQVIADNPKSLPESAITAIIMSALTVEAFVNELGESADFDRQAADYLGVSSTALEPLRDLANTLKEIEENRGTIGLKYQMAYKILAGHTFDPGRSPFQEFQQLVRLRDLLVHLKPGDRINSTGHVEPRVSLIRDFQQKGLTRTPGRRPDDPLGGTSWLQEIQTIEMASWAYRAACGIIKVVGEVIPTDPSHTGLIDLLRNTTQNLAD